MPQPPIYDHVVFQFEVSKPLIKICGVPPEEMRLDRYARTFRRSRIVGQERVTPVDELTAMGYPREMLLDHIQSQSTPEFTQEAQLPQSRSDDVDAGWRRREVRRVVHARRRGR